MKFALRAVIGLSVILFLLYFLIVPLIMGYAATISARSELGDAPKGFSEVQFENKSGDKLAAWYAEPKNGIAVIVVHGSGNSRENVRDFVEVLHENEFGILALDIHGHGESEGDTNRFGWEATQDIEAAVNFLNDHDEVRSIKAVGFSMGGEILLGAASELSEIEAIVSDGATYRSFAEFNDLNSMPDSQKSLSMTRFATFFVKLFSGDEEPYPILDSIVDADNTEFFFIAAGNETEEVDFNKMFFETIGDEKAELWVIDGVNHTGGFDEKPDEYSNRIIKFLEGVAE